MRAVPPLLLAVLIAIAIGCDGEEGGGATAPHPEVIASPAPVTSSTPAPAPTSSATSTPPAEPASTTAVTATVGATPAPLTAPAPVRFVEVMGGRRFDRPVEAVPYPGGLVLVAEQSGLILLLDATTGEGGTFLDLRSQVSRDANEEGLLSLSLDPEFASNGRLYAYYSVEEGERRTRLSRFTAHDAAADPGSELAILEVAQPFRNHNGGAVRFGPDGMLYLGLGDGGSAGDPQANGQDPGTLLGTILRIDVRQASESETYLIPPDNPLVEVSGARPEVWAYGLRNPWRMTFDPESGELWAGDVGQQRIEEVDRIVRGGNYGWNRLEGDDCYRPRSGCDPEGTVLPATSYNHDQGCSITGGVVYRGAQVPELNGRYVYGDFCSGRVWALDVASGGDGIRVADTGAAISSFAQIGEELWLLRFGGAVLRATSP